MDCARLLLDAGADKEAKDWVRDSLARVASAGEGALDLGSVLIVCVYSFLSLFYFYFQIVFDRPFLCYVSR